jgi:hypothetical protein
MLRFRIASWGAWQSWTHFQDSLVPRPFLINWAVVRLAHVCPPATYHPCSNRSESLPESSFHCLLSKYASITSVHLFKKNGDALFLDSCQTCPISHFMQRNSSVHGFLARTTCTNLITTESYNIAICVAVLICANTPPPVDVDVDNIYITISTS